MAEECLFCKIASGDIPSKEVYSDDEFYAFEDINPAAPTHLLIIPREHISGVTELSDEGEGLLGRMILRANRIAEAAGLNENGFRYVVNSGHHGGQTVYHLHLHILGGRFLSWPPG